MSAITPEASTTPDLSPAFHRPIAPAPDAALDGEMLCYYFDAAWTTKDIAEHFKLSVATVAAWFQRPDIAALISFITASSERRARDIVLEDLPATINILRRISKLRNNDNLSRAASSALLRFSRGRAPTKPSPKPPSTASTRSRRAESSPARDMHDPTHNPTHNPAPPAAQTPGRDLSPPAPSLVPAHHAHNSDPSSHQSTPSSHHEPTFPHLDHASIAHPSPCEPHLLSPHTMQRAAFDQG